MLFRQFKSISSAFYALFADSGFAMAGAVAYSFVLSIPVVGSYLGTFLFGGATVQCSANSNLGCTTVQPGCTWTEVTVADSVLYASQAAMLK